MNFYTGRDGVRPDGDAPSLVDIGRQEVSARAVTDPEIYALEKTRLWAKSWLLVAHDSEVPNPGDFVTRYMGEDVVIVTRDRTGALEVLLNVCTHRGMPLCRVDMGHTPVFTCPYHGWTFGLDGAFKGLPVANQNMAGSILDRSELGLKRARVETFCGIVFATFDQAAPPLSDWLGDVAWYLKCNYGRTTNGMEVLGPPQRWVIDGNWKLAAEQFVGADAYHVYTLHRSMFELETLGKQSDITTDEAPSGDGVNVSFPEGHSVRCAPSYAIAKRQGQSSLDKLMQSPPPGATPDLVPQMAECLDEGQMRLLADMPPAVGGLFPNVATYCFPVAHPDGGMLGAAHGLHVFVPRGPDRVEWWNWTLVEKDAPQALKDRIAETAPILVGPTGMIEADDGECWPFMQRVAQGAVAAEGVTGTMKYHALVGEKRPEGWPGGGVVSEGFGKDDGQWAFWRRYAQFMEGTTW